MKDNSKIFPSWKPRSSIKNIFYCRDTNYKDLLYIEDCKPFLKLQDCQCTCSVKKAPPKSHREGPFSMCTDTVSIQRVSIPFSLICCLTASIGTSSLWKIPAARAASTSVFLKTSEKRSTFPAPLEAMTGMETLSLMCFTSSMSKPLLVPSLSIQLSNISPAPSFSQTCVNCFASTSRPSLPPFTVH